MIKLPLKLLMLIQWMFVLFLFMVVSDCSNEPQFTCGYNPEKYHSSKSLSFESIYLKATPIDFDKLLVAYGRNNKFCIANGNGIQKIDNKYFINMQLIKDDYAFYIHGGGGFSYTLIFESKNVSTLAEKDIKLFCKMISNHIDTDKVKYHETTGKLCEY